MIRRMLVVVIAFLPHLYCTEAGIQPIDNSTTALVDDLLTINGSMCTSTPDEVTFPVKIMLIVDCSGSMQFSDPSDANTTTVMNGSTPQFDQNAVQTCLNSCNGSGTDAGTCNTICQTPHNPGRQGAVQALIDRFKNNPAVSFAIIRFNGRITVNGSGLDKGVGGFTNNETVLNNALAGLSQADITTDYQGALTSAYQLLEKDMTETNPVDRARTKYVIIFMSDGGPNPQCKEGCGNDTIDLPGITVDDWCDVPRDKWCDNFPINSAEHCKDMTSWYPHLDEPCRDYNSEKQLKQKVLEIISLGSQYGAGEIRLHTAFLFVPTLPKAIMDLFELEGSSNTPCTQDSDCPVATEKCALNGPTGQCKGKSEKLLIDMAQWGEGMFRNFASGQQIDFLSFNYASVARPFGMTNFFVTNTNAMPDFNKLLVDSDGDGVDDQTEFEAKPQMDSTKTDTDDDGYNDKLEFDHLTAGFDPSDKDKPEMRCEGDNRLDVDGDGLNACEEKVLGTDPKIVDSDRDRIPDGIEFYWGTNPLQADDKADYDFDGKLNGEEIRIHAQPKLTDPRIQSEFKYIYDVTEQPDRPDLKKCFDFTVRRVRLVTTTEKNVAGSLGYNDILLYFGQGPVDDPLDFGKFKAACIHAQYVKDSFKFPADGKITLKPEDFMDLPELLKRRQEALSDPNCKLKPPDPSCTDPCKGAALP